MFDLAVLLFMCRVRGGAPSRFHQLPTWPSFLLVNTSHLLTSHLGVETELIRALLNTQQPSANSHKKSTAISHLFIKCCCKMSICLLKVVVVRNWVHDCTCCPTQQAVGGAA
jgi:hypothetical protein